MLAACRPEDGYFLCKSNSACKQRQLIALSTTDPCTDETSNEIRTPPRKHNHEISCLSITFVPSNLASCNHNEFKCRTTNRCIPRSYLETDRRCKFNFVGSHLVSCRATGMFVAIAYRIDTVGRPYQQT